jgi:hypothetical protein
MSRDPIAERTAEILRVTKGDVRVQTLADAEREEWAREQAQQQHDASTRRATARAAKLRLRAEREAAIAGLSAKAGVSPEVAAEALKRHRATERSEEVKRAEAVLAGRDAGLSPPESAVPASGWSPPGIGDFPGLYRTCIASLRADHQPLSWESAAAWMQENADPPRRLRRGGTDDYADLHAKTVAGWAKRAGLPHPREYHP